MGAKREVKVTLAKKGFFLLFHSSLLRDDGVKRDVWEEWFIRISEGKSYQLGSEGQ